MNLTVSSVLFLLFWVLQLQFCAAKAGIHWERTDNSIWITAKNNVLMLVSECSCADDLVHCSYKMGLNINIKYSWFSYRHFFHLQYLCSVKTLNSNINRSRHLLWVWPSSFVNKGMLLSSSGHCVFSLLNVRKHPACCRMRGNVTELKWGSIVNEIKCAVHGWHRKSSLTFFDEKLKGGTYQKSHPGNYNSGFNYLTVQEEAGNSVHHHEQFPCCKHQIRLQLQF